MTDESVIIPSNESDWTSLSRTKQGRLFKKHILNKGGFRHPVTGTIINVDDDFVAKMKKNFDNKVCDIVQVPLADKNNAHSEDPDRNIGEVVDIQEENGKVYAYIDARDGDRASKLGKTLLGVSAMLSLNYKDTKTGELVGPTLLHACVTNRPYITDLEDYQEIVLASADTLGETAVLLSVEDEAADNEENAMPMTRDELIAELKDKHGVDVAALESQASLSQTIADALTEAGAVKLSQGDTVSSEDVVAAVAELATNNVTLSARVETLEQAATELTNAAAVAAVEALIVEGKIQPRAKDAMVTLKLTNAELFEALVPTEPVVELSAEQGTSEEPPAEKTAEEKAEAEVAALTADPKYAHLFGKSAK